MRGTDLEHRPRSSSFKPRLFLPQHVAWVVSNTGLSCSTLSLLPQRLQYRFNTSLHCNFQAHVSTSRLYLTASLGFGTLSIIAMYSIISAFPFPKLTNIDITQSVFESSLQKYIQFTIVLPKNPVVKLYNCLLTNNLYSFFFNILCSIERYIFIAMTFSQTFSASFPLWSKDSKNYQNSCRYYSSTKFCILSSQWYLSRKGQNSKKPFMKHTYLFDQLLSCQPSFQERSIGISFQLPSYFKFHLPL